MLRTLSIALLCLLAACAPRPVYVPERDEDLFTAPQIRPEEPGVEDYASSRPQATGQNSQEIVGHTDIPLTKAQPESTLGNFLADAMLEGARKVDAGVVAAISNYGGLRLAYLAPGPITRSQLAELMPFDNRIVIVEIPGSVLREFCHLIAMRRGWPVSGLSFVIRDKQAEDVQIAGAALDPALVYKIAVNDYIARGGDRCELLRPLRRHATRRTVRDAMIQYLATFEREGKPLHPRLQGRIRYAD